MPLRGAPFRLSGRLNVGAALTCQAAFAVFVCMATVLPANAGQRELACSIMLMDAECTQYRQRHEHAIGNLQHARIEHEYRQLLKERQRACRCSETRDEREVQDALDLREMLTQAGLVMQ